eukprot:Trichotokara_eunicae@DN8259_c0_g1_i1.p1
MYGGAVVQNLSGGQYTLIEYLRKGWFSGIQHSVRGIVFDSDGTMRYLISGVWSREVWVETFEKQEESDRHTSPNNQPSFGGGNEMLNPLLSTGGDFHSAPSSANSGRINRKKKKKKKKKKVLCVDT